VLDLRQAHTRYRIAKESLSAAQVALDANREYLDTELGRYGAGQVTATDLALAQTNYLAAENNVTQARCRALLARAALDKAMGKRPLSR
jgi:outer membrane protein TolC